MNTLPEAIIAKTAIHEAGHAVARWWLDRRRFYPMPHLRFVAVILTESDILRGGRGDERPELGGICAGDPAMMPEIERVIIEQPHINTLDRRQFMRKAATADCVDTMAGPIAEYLARGEPLDDWQDWDCYIGDSNFADGYEESGDHWQVWQRVPFLGRRWRLHLCRAFETADHIMRRHQPQIEALAEALVRHGQIDGEEVYQLFDAIGPAVRGRQ